MLGRARAAGRHDGHAERVVEREQEVEVVAALRPVAVHARRENLARAAGLALGRPRDRAAARRRAAAVREDLPARGRPAGPLGVDGEDGALGSVARGDVREQVRPGERGRVHADLVGPGVEHRPGVVGRPDAAADGQRDAQLVGRPPDDGAHRLARLGRGRDVEKDEFVGARGVVEARLLDRVAGVAEVHEADAFDDAPVVDV